MSDTLYKAETNVPIPPDGRIRRGQRVHPVLAEGESYFIPLKGYSNETSALTGARAVAQKNGYRVISRVVLEHGVRGVRVWRVS